ncbi:protein kintoun [Myripristis murdjan]|uniref:protein kintoun n=1 Tax=Myripristis murdjan TaxID=586833 RepID=UPI0011761E30|nr:protein kintoun [Myripristis murdjan]
MEVGDQLKKLNMTPDEVDRLSNAFKDEKFKEMLRDYAKELSDPENKKKYEEEIKLLEEERGNTIDFIHPEPFKALRTSLNGTQKCFINICANEKVGKPECKLGTSEDGRRGQQWSLPHSLHPGRPDTDPKGKKIMIYDVVFHPDTLHMASRNKRFMNMVLSTAIQGIQENFKVILDKNKVRELTIKYKGTPQPCVIRKPIPGYKAKERPAHPDPLAFPYPDEKRPTTATTPAQIKDSVDANPVASQIQSHKPKEPIVPKYTVKYRSFIDLQDFRYSRDSAQSPRPKEIVVTVDMPLLKSAAAASLEVKGKSLLLESEKPAYRLEVVLAYPVDEDKGEAKFNKQRGQLTITLPVLPSNETYDFALRTTQTDSENDRLEEESAVQEGEKWQEHEREGEKREEEESGMEKQQELRHHKRGDGKREEEESEGNEEEKLKDHERKVEKREEEEEEENQPEQNRENQGTEEESKGNEEEKLKDHEREAEKRDEEESGVEREEKLKKQMREDEKSEEEEERRAEEEERTQQKWEGRSERKGGRGVEERQKQQDVAAEDKNSAQGDVNEASPKTENQPFSDSNEKSSGTGEERGQSLKSCVETRHQMKTSEFHGEMGQTQEDVDYSHGNLNKVEMDPFLTQTSSENSQIPIAVSALPAMQPLPNQVHRPEEIRDVLVSEKAQETSASGNSSKMNAHLSEEDIDEDDLMTEQTFPVHHTSPPPVVLREIDEDRNERVISDHSTSAGFIFQNSLLYELD